MKRLIRASSDTHVSRAEFTWGDVVLLLQQIKELQGLEISLSGNPSTGTRLTVGDYVYTIEDGFTSFPASQFDR